MARFSTSLTQNKFLLGLCASCIFASVVETALGKASPQYSGIEGCYLEMEHCSYAGDCVAGVKENIKQFDADRKTILQQFASHPGSNSAKADALNGLLFLKFNPSVGYEFFKGAVISELNIKANVTDNKASLRLDKHGYSDDPFIKYYTPKKTMKVVVSVGDGKIQDVELAKWQTTRHQCDYETTNFYFSRPIHAKKAKIFIACVDTGHCSMKLDWIKKFKQYDVYKLTSPNGKSPDFLIVTDQTAGGGSQIKILHILRSTKNGWEFQYSGDFRWCESYC